MIRLSQKSDVEKIIHLWNEAFGDSEDEIRFFLDSRYNPDNTVIYEIDDDIAAVLFLLEGNMSINGSDYPSYYLYAACTLKKYRGRGIMTDLLAYTKEITNSRSKHFICLRPGEKSLFEFYQKHGYKNFFKVKKVTYDFSCINQKTETEICNSSYETDVIRNKAFSGGCFFKWDKQAIDFAFSHNRFYGGNSLITRKGYLLYAILDNVLSVKETTFTNEFDLLDAVSNISHDDIDRINVLFPPWANEKGEIVDYAMITAVNEKSQNIIEEIDNAYLGLTLE